MNQSDYSAFLCLLFFTGSLVYYMTRVKSKLSLGEKPLVPIVCLIVALALGAALRISYVPRGFQAFYNEYEIYNTARGVAERTDFSVCVGGRPEKCEYRAKDISYAPGMVFLSSIPLKITQKDSPDVMFAINNVLGIVAIVMVFVMTLTVSGSPVAAVASAFLTAVFPLHLLLSGNGSQDMLAFLALTSLITFFYQYMRRPSVHGIISMFFIFGTILLIEPFYLVFAMVMIPVMALKKLRLSIGIAIGAIFTGMMFAPVASLFKNIPAITLSDMLGGNILQSNFGFFISSEYMPKVYLALGVLGLLGGAAKERRGILWLPLLFATGVIAVSIAGFFFRQGDWVRYSAGPSAILLAAGGICVETIIRRLDSLKPLRDAALVMIVIACGLAVPVARQPLNPYMWKQDAFLRKAMPGIPSGCIVFSPPASAAMTYTTNASYEAARLFDKGFSARHAGECRFFVEDAACFTTSKAICQKAARHFDFEPVKAKTIEKLYTARISRITPKKQGE